MRIAFIKQKYVSSGGGERYLERLITACIAHGHDVHLITTAWPRDEIKGLQLHMVSTSTRTRAARMRSFSSAAASCIADNDFNLTFSLDRTVRQDVWRAGEGVHRVWLDRRRAFEPAFKVWLAERTPGHRALLELEAACVRNSRQIITNSHMVKHDIEQVYGDAAGKIAVIYNGADPAHFHVRDRDTNRIAIREKLGVEPGAPVLLFAGSGFRRKGLPETLSILPDLPDAILIVLGRDHPTPWKSMAQRLGVAARTRFLSPEADLAPYYHAADLLVLPTWFDPFPNVGLEALFCGTPVVTTRYAGVHELITSQDLGSVVSSPAATSELRDAIHEQCRLGVTEQRPERISGAVAQHTMEANVEQTLRVITDLEG